MMKNESRHKVIGIVCATIIDTGTQNSMHALVDEAVSRGYKVVVLTNFTYYGIEYTHADTAIFDLLNKPVYDGLILMPESIKSGSVWEKVLSDAKKTGLPFVCIDRDVPDCVSITFDYGGAFEQVMRHMVEVHKPKRINFIGGIKDNSFSEERLAVFKKVLADNGREFDPGRFGYGQFWEAPTTGVLDRFYDGETEPPDAILCVNDTEAITVSNYLRDRDIRIPEDVIVSGFDGIEEEKYNVPRLTTAVCDLEGMADTALDLLETLLKGEKPEKRLSVIHYALRVSQSCGCVPVAEGERANKLMHMHIERKNLERHERRMFRYSAFTGTLNSYEDLSRLMPEFCECAAWCCLEKGILSDDDGDEDGTQYDKSIRMIMSCKNEEEVQHPETYSYDKDVAEDEIIPDFEAVLDEYDALLCAPMSYQGESMGYICQAIDSKGFNYLFAQRFAANTCQIFETLKTRIRLQKAYAKVADMHMRDPMTGIYNRRGFYIRMSELTTGGSGRFTLFSVDLDKLKSINDTFGHYTGDKAIIAAADIVSRAAGPNGVCARFGGDEFVVVIPDEEDAGSYADRVNEMTEAFNSSHEEPFELGLSIGNAALCITDRENIDIAMKAADAMMYECKKRHHAGRKEQERTRAGRLTRP